MKTLIRLLLLICIAISFQLSTIPLACGDNWMNYVLQFFLIMLGYILVECYSDIKSHGS